MSKNEGEEIQFVKCTHCGLSYFTHRNSKSICKTFTPSKNSERKDENIRTTTE